MYLVYNTVVLLCQFFGNVGNSSQNENMFLQKKLIGLLNYDPLAQCVYFIRPNTLLLCIFLFCILLLYRADSQVEVQIRILLQDPLFSHFVRNLDRLASQLIF